MSNYFFHPLGDYAKNYIDGTATFSQRPHTRITHGFSKMDFGCGGNLPVYSMTNGTVVDYRNTSGESINICVVRCTDCGYSRMMAKLKGGSTDDYPIYIAYIEMSKLTITGKQVPFEITMGTQIGLTNNVYAGSNLHIDIGPYDRYSLHGQSNPYYVNKDTKSGGRYPMWWITLDREDAYGDKGEGYSLADHLDSNFSMDAAGNLTDSAGKKMGVESKGILYPINSGGGPVTYNSQAMGSAGVSSDTRTSRFYSYSTWTQTPFYSSGMTVSDNSAAIPSEYSEIYWSGDSRVETVFYPNVASKGGEGIGYFNDHYSEVLQKTGVNIICWWGVNGLDVQKTAKAYLKLAEDMNGKSRIYVATVGHCPNGTGSGRLDGGDKKVLISEYNPKIVQFNQTLVSLLSSNSNITIIDLYSFLIRYEQQNGAAKMTGDNLHYLQPVNDAIKSYVESIILG